MNIKSKKIIAKKSKAETTASKPTQIAGSKIADTVSYAAGSFLDQRGGMVPTVRLGKRASTKVL